MSYKAPATGDKISFKDMETEVIYKCDNKVFVKSLTEEDTKKEERERSIALAVAAEEVKKAEGEKPNRAEPEEKSGEFVISGVTLDS